MKYAIKNRFSNATIIELELPSDIEQLPPSRRCGWAASEALKRDAYLSGADLSGADLRGANLRDANLSGADLRGANLSDAYLSDANLSGADLSGANLSDANLSDAYLSGADLRDANLSGADLRGADLSGADLRGANLSGADLRGAKNVPETKPETDAERIERQRAYAADYRSRHPDVPVVEAIDAKILAIVEAKPEALDMGSWHACETTHCRAGWAIHLAGKEGYALEEKFSAERAGAMIYRASVGFVPNFFAGNQSSLADIKARAAEQVPA